MGDARKLGEDLVLAADGRVPYLRSITKKHACFQDYPRVIAILAQGPELNVMKNRTTALMNAAYYGAADIVQVLIEAKADLDFRRSARVFCFTVCYKTDIHAAMNRIQ